MKTKDLKILSEDFHFSATLCGNELDFATTWGLFNPKSIDVGTDLLLKKIELKGDEDILDIGCGYGPIGVALAKNTTGKVDMIDKDFVAVEYSQKNADCNLLNNVSCFLSNGLAQIPEGKKYDLIVSNIPAKIGNELLWIIFNDVKAHLKPEGRFVVVTIAGLKDYVKRNFKEVFGNYKKLGQGGTYLISQAFLESK